MGYFTRDLSESGGLDPLSRDRIRATLDRQEASYGVDDDGDIGGYWDGHLFYFFVLGANEEYLQVRGHWNRRVALEHYDRLVSLVNDWNAAKLWPKAYVRPDVVDRASEPSLAGVYSEHTVDYEHGVSDDQLALHLACAISTSGQLFDHLDEHFPEEAARAEAEADG